MSFQLQYALILLVISFLCFSIDGWFSYIFLRAYRNKHNQPLYFLYLEKMENTGKIQFPKALFRSWLQLMNIRPDCSLSCWDICTFLQGQTLFLIVALVILRHLSIKWMCCELRFYENHYSLVMHPHGWCYKLALNLSGGSYRFNAARRHALWHSDTVHANFSSFQHDLMRIPSSHKIPISIS